MASPSQAEGSQSGKKRPRSPCNESKNAGPPIQKLLDDVLELDEALQSHILSFCDDAWLYLLLEASTSNHDENITKSFENPIAKALVAKSSIHGSFLLRIFPNSIANPRSVPHDVAISRFLKLPLQKHEINNKINTTSATVSSHLKFLECQRLLSLTGRSWLSSLHQAPIEYLNFEGCASLDPKSLISFLENSPNKSLKHLNLIGCHKVGPPVLRTIAAHHPQLQDLSIGGCSATIDDTSIQHLLLSLEKLLHFDCQALNGLKNSSQMIQWLPASLKSFNFSACKLLRMGGPEAAAIAQRHQYFGTADLSRWGDGLPETKHKSLMHIVMDSAASRASGPTSGVLAYFALGRCLREVHMAGCETIRDWEIDILAQTCGKTLACLQMRACKITDAAMFAITKHCRVLTELDVSACFQITDRGIIELCQNLRSEPDSGDERSSGKRNTLRVLRLSSVLNVTDTGVGYIALLKSLHLLDLENCLQVSAPAVCLVILQLPRLIEVNARDIRSDTTGGLAAQLRLNIQKIPVGLRMLNKRVLKTPGISSRCCSVRLESQRISKSKTGMAAMYHCVDCNLIPPLDRGICANCVVQCHKDHVTYVGGWTRFYCDCPYGVGGNACECVFDKTEATAMVGTSVRAG